MRDERAFEGTIFLGLARGSKRDPYRLSLFARHFEADERPLALLAIHGGTLIVTDRRVLELRAHLEVHGAWNVKEFQGYEVRREIARNAVVEVAHRAEREAGSTDVKDIVVLTTSEDLHEVLVSHGPAATLPEEDFRLLRDAILGAQPK